MDKRGKVSSFFRRKSICLLVPKIFVVESFDVSFFRGFCHELLLKFFLSHNAEDFRRATILCCISKKFR